MRRVEPWILVVIGILLLGAILNLSLALRDMKQALFKEQENNRDTQLEIKQLLVTEQKNDHGIQRHSSSALDEMKQLLVKEQKSNRDTQLEIKQLLVREQKTIRDTQLEIKHLLMKEQTNNHDLRRLLERLNQEESDDGQEERDDGDAEEEENQYEDEVFQSGMYSKCPKAPAPTDATFLQMQAAARQASIDFSPPTPTPDGSFVSGMMVPFEVKVLPKRNRALFLTEPVKRGTLIWARGNLACFHARKEFDIFLSFLPFTIQCDVHHWIFASSETLEFANTSATQATVCIALDRGSMVNHDDNPTTGCQCEGLTKKEVRERNRFGLSCDCDGNYALRDLEPGEEITEDYDMYDEITDQWWALVDRGPIPDKET